jgi:hypothetical protein
MAMITCYAHPSCHPIEYVLFPKNGVLRNFDLEVGEMLTFGQFGEE